MALIMVEKPASLTTLKLTVSKHLVDEFEKELFIFNKNNKPEKLNFDNFATKLVNELKKINKNKRNNDARIPSIYNESRDVKFLSNN